jgi:hypothetical protein
LAAATPGEKEYWAGQVASGALTPENFQSAFNNAVNEYRTSNPNDPYTQYVNNYQAQQAPQANTNSAASTSAPSPLQSNVDQWFAGNPNAGQQDIANAVQSIGGLTPELSNILAAKFGTTADQINSNYNNIIQDKTYTDLVTNAYGGIGRTGIGSAVSNIDQGGLDYWKGQLASGAITPDQFNSVFSNTVNQYRSANPNDAYTQYVTNYQLGQQTDPLKTNLSTILADKQISFDEANAIKTYQDQYGFSAADIARVTGRPIEEINQVLGARTNIIGQNITANLTNPLGLVDFAQTNKLSAKDLASASGGALTEASAAALLDKGSTFQGRVELASPEAYNQIKGLAQNTANENFGGKVQDWQVQLFTPLDPAKAGIPTQLDMTPGRTEVRTGGDDNGTFQYNVEIPPQVKTQGVSFNENTGGYTLDKPVRVNGLDVYVSYDANGKVTGYTSPAATWLNDKDHVFGRWNADGSANPLGTRSTGGGFVKGVSNDLAGVLSELGPVWTAAKIAYPALNLVDVGLDVGRSEVNLGTGVKGALGYAGLQDAAAADLTNPSSVNYGGSGIDVGSGVSPAVQMTQNANLAKLGAAGITAVQAADNGNYAPILALAANVSGVNKMPQVAASMNVLSAANAIATNNAGGFLSAAGNLTNSPDLKLAGAASNFIQAYESGNQAMIATAGMALASAVNANAPNAASTVRTTLFGPTTPTTPGPQGSPINPSGPPTNTSDSGPLSGINLAGADNRYEMGGPPIFAGTAKAANVSVPVGYRLMSMDEADARPAGSYYDITQNAWLAPDAGAMADLTDLQKSLTGPVPEGYGRDVTDLDRTGGQNGVSGNAPYTSSTGPLSTGNGMGVIDIKGDRLPPDGGVGVIDIVGDRLPPDDYPLSPVVPTDVNPLGPVTPVVVNPPVVTPPPVVKPPSTPINPTPTKTTTASPLSAAAQTPEKLDSSPQGLRSTVQRDKKILKELQMLFGTLTPELVSALEDRGIRVPPVQDVKEDRRDEEEPRTEKQIAEDRALETTFAATGGSIASKIDPRITYAQAGLLPEAKVIDIPSRMGGLKHLHDMLVPRRPTTGMAKGGLPSKYAQATPDGHKPEFITGLTGYYASGAGTGQSDDIDAMLHDGDYVADADLVAALGDGSSKAGAEALEKFRRSVPHQEYAEGGQPVAAKIADGEYVFPASFVTAIGKGDNKAGAALLDKMRETIRAHKRSAPTSKIPPKAKSPLDYLKMVKG